MPKSTYPYPSPQLRSLLGTFAKVGVGAWDHYTVRREIDHDCAALCSCCVSLGFRTCSWQRDHSVLKFPARPLHVEFERERMPFYQAKLAQGAICSVRKTFRIVESTACVSPNHLCSIVCVLLLDRLRVRAV